MQKAAIDAIAKEYGSLNPNDRAKLRALSPADLEAARKNTASARTFVGTLTKILVMIFFVIPLVLVTVGFLVAVLIRP